MRKIILISIVFVIALAFQRNDATAQGVINAPRDGVHPREHLKDQVPVPYPYLREADVMWEKRIWRTIDMREKINQSLYYPTAAANGRKSFMVMILDALREGSVTPYQFDPYNDEFLIPLTFQDIMGKVESVDTIQATRPYPPYDTYDTVVAKNFNPSDVKRLRLKEDWFFDRERSVLDVRIIGIAPVTELFEADGETYKGEQPLFWLYFDECRPLFAKNDVFNRQNASERRSYEDIFMKRMFGSFIYKEENVYDRKIQEYATGLDALLESDRIRNDIFNFEHDLWEY